MRMWMVDPKTMCQKHLLGEHVELHMFVGHLNRNKSVRGYIENNCLEATSIHSRHDELVREMERRGYKHKSPLPALTLIDWPGYDYKIDRRSAEADLRKRCFFCRLSAREEPSYGEDTDVP